MLNQNPATDLSIITTTDPAAKQLFLLLQAISQLATQTERMIEVVIVDDLKLWPSDDASLIGYYPNLTIQIIWYPEHQGQLQGLLTGIAAASGSNLLTIDPDMHSCVWEIPTILKLMGKGYYVVHCVRPEHPSTSRLRRFGSIIANAILRSLTGIIVRDMGSPMILLQRKTLLQHTEAFKHGNPKLNLYRLLGNQIALYPLATDCPVGMHSQYSFMMLVKTFLILLKDCLVLRITIARKACATSAFLGQEEKNRTSEREKWHQ